MQPYPLSFRPVLKQTIWGGRRLGSLLGKPIGSDENYAESWEIVDHGDDQSVVTDGDLAGQTLAQVIAGHRQWLLGDQVPQGSFPLLLKYLDCNRVLSVQVHPDDAYAKQMPQPDLGKTEAWYIVASDPGSQIYAGLKSGVDQSTLREAIAAGQTEETLHTFHPEVGDIVFIPAGTVHALGSGLVVAEIQQSSDTTFRLFDWNRVDDAGNGRPLHIQSSLEVTDYQRGPVAAVRCDALATGWQTMVSCDKFVLNVLLGGTDTIGGDGRFHLVTVPRGRATLVDGNRRYPLETGATVMLPAAMGACGISVSAPDSTVLASHLPD
ncbi:putative mannose-6-phosphate isomerase GmuF [Rubripirellula lacrimiformis]|uniref:Putative mannose-6-phosphate isomerase GmuF n=1 Tax=Rubripirellula lacrimiformis TaxID=1930273 RepID=A0A517N6Z8_9BACT|nr:type I phosphomannose isomerase catalytic subunit [Rubripirellula lacrimiformis]QDT02924.1 putative mannose-6-phosphate isomerase GmuF [Rubripirellula lacrimiformis]